MTNFLALGLVLTSLLTAGFFTPTPHPKSAEDVIVKEGHRVVVVEYEEDDGSTKVLIKPHESDQKGFLENVDEKLSEKMESVKEGVKEGSSSLVCDAYGKCKEKIASTFTRTKEEVSDKVAEAKENVKEEAKEMVETAKKVKKEGEKELREILHHAGEVGREFFDYFSPRERVAPVAGILHLMGFAAAYGMCVWITFASSSVLAAALPREQFSTVQSRIYPAYFKAMGYCVGMALVGHLMGPGRRLSPVKAVVVEGGNFAAALGMILVNLLWLEPRATKVMLERMKKEKEEGAGKEGHPTSTATAGRGTTAEEAATRAQIMELNQALQRLNSYSSVLNALTLVTLTWHLVHLSQRLQTTC